MNSLFENQNQEHTDDNDDWFVPTSKVTNKIVGNIATLKALVVGYTLNDG